MTILEVGDSKALFKAHIYIIKINTCICTNLWYVFKKPFFPPYKHLTFGHSLVKLLFLQCTLGEQSTTATGKVFENTTGGRLKEPKSLFLYGVFHTKHKHWGVLTELRCPPAVYAYDIGQLHSFGWNSMLETKVLTYWGGLDCTCQQKWAHIVILMNLRGKSSYFSPKI